MRGRLIQILLALLVLASVLALCAWLLLRGSLPALDGRQALPGLAGTVTLARDANGTVTIDAGSEADALRALGYVHAQERYFEMDLMRRSAAGELAALVGPPALPLDRQHRRHLLRMRIRHGLRQITGDHRGALDAYVAGVNAGLGRLSVKPWPYLLLRQSPQPWQAEDTPLAAMAMYFDLQGGDNAHELAMWKLQPHLPPALFSLLARDGSRWDAPLQGAARGDAVLPGPDQVNLRTLPSPPLQAAGEAPASAPGSNNFAVAGSLTSDGRAILADDMHLSLRAPNLWFRARLRYPDPRAPGGRVDVQGFTLPGLPLVVVGSNGHVAWGFTNSYIDSMDWKLERPCGEVQTRDCVETSSFTQTLHVAGGAPETLTFEQSDWGPVMQRAADGRALSLRWTAHLPGALNLQLMDFARAGSVEDALAIADTVGMPTQNLLLADRAGRIAWRLLGPVPQRAAGCPPGGEVIDPRKQDCPPWSLSSAASPLLRSPEHDRLWTANARVLDGAELAKVGDGGYSLGARALQIRDGLQARPRFDERALLAIQLDDRARLLTPWHALLAARAAAARTPALQALAQAAAHWEGRAAVDSVSYRIVHDWRLAVHARIADGLTAPARAALGKDFAPPSLPQLEGVAWPLVTQRPLHLLPRRFASWDALFEDAAREVSDRLQAIGPLAQRSWGERNTAAICHPLAAAIPLVGRRWLCMPAQPLAGDSNMPRVTAPAFGASQRMVVAPGHEARGIIEMPGGQSGHPLSPYWGAGHAAWVTGQPTPFLPGAAQHTLTLVPAAR